jgi:hypothetical protein
LTQAIVRFDQSILQFAAVSCGHSLSFRSYTTNELLRSLPHLPFWRLGSKGRIAKPESTY